MFTRVVVAGGVAVLVTGGTVAAGRWRDGQVAACATRGTRLAALAPLESHPRGFRAEAPYDGCDTERIIAYAGRQFVPADGSPDLD